MKTTEVIDLHGTQVVKLPDDFRFATDEVSIRRHGDGVILSPIKCGTWPDRFFESIRIDDVAFSRPDQGQTPPSPSLS